MQDVDKLIKEMSNLPTGCIIGFVYMSLSDGISWLKRAMEVLSVSYCGRGIRNSHLNDAEDILMKSQVFIIYNYDCLGFNSRQASVSLSIKLNLVLRKNF